jgi:hypothetical protein
MTDAPKKAASTRRPAKPVLLTGGNPQIAKAAGDAPVQAWIAASPGWKREVARRLDALVARTVPGVRKAVKWNSPFDGVGVEGGFLARHGYATYLKVTFFRGTSLDPPPPVASKMKHVRYLHVGEAPLDEDQFVDWVRQASRLPGERM